ncbi:YdeI/OmpD-associated family protein [Pedobacter sp. PWIIR3]
MTKASENETSFKAPIGTIGINPFVFVPEEILVKLFQQAGRSKSPIPIKGKVNDKPYKQTLMKYKGAWRLYINTKMLANSPKRIGEMIELSIVFDKADRTIIAHPDLLKAIAENLKAKEVFDSLTPSLKNEIIRYISHLKSEESIQRNIQKAVDFLLGKGKFVGRDL